MVESLSWPRRLLNTGHMAALAAVERRVPFWPPERIERLQSRRIRETVRHAYETVPYYRQTMDELGLTPGDVQTAADLAKLPLLDGALVRQDSGLFASSDFDDRARRTFLTSGSGSTSSIRKEIYWDETSLLKRAARAERDRVVLVKLAGQTWRRRQLHIYPPTAAVSRVMALGDAQTWVPHAMVRRQVFSAEEPFAALVAKLNEFRPHIAFSYGSYMEHFFRYLAGTGATAAVPRVWRYGGDMLSPAGKELIEERFGCTVYSTYQAAETGRIGFQCERRQGFHLNIDLCAVRIVDEAGRDVPPGQDGEIVVSNLHNRATVLLNYRLGDWGALATGPCPCGRTLPLLERLNGRQSEAIALPDGRVFPSVMVGSLFSRQLAAALKAQVAQPEPGRVRWRIVPFVGVDREELRGALIDRGREVLGAGVTIEIEFVDDIPPTPAGKFPLVATTRRAGD